MSSPARHLFIPAPASLRVCVVLRASFEVCAPRCLGCPNRRRLDNNNIAVIPPEIGQLVNLKYLCASPQQLALLFAEADGVQGMCLHSLRCLGCPNHRRLSYNNITVIPPEIGQLVNLQDLCAPPQQPAPLLLCCAPGCRG